MTKPTRYKARTCQPEAEQSDETRQQAMLATIRRLTREQGYPPTLREVGRILDIDSTGYLTWLRDDLVRRALLTHDSNRARTMRLTPAGHLAVRSAEERKRLTTRGRPRVGATNIDRTEARR